MNAALVFSLVALGISSLIGQVVLVRELMVVFYGNEFFIGWTLFSWLLWVAIGSWIGGRVAGRVPEPTRLLALCHALVALLLPAGVLLVRASRLVVGTIPGEIPNLLPALGYAFLVTAPLCLVLGIQFIVAARAWRLARTAPLSRALGEAYVYETAGFVIGGLVFGYVLVVLNEFVVAGLLAWMNALAGATLYALSRKRQFVLRLLLVAVSAVATVLFFLSGQLDRLTGRLRFPAQAVVESRNSIYGHIAVTRTGGQHNFYENGLLLGPDRDAMSNEYLAHFPLLYHPDPKRVLLIGGGFNGAVSEILKHNPERVDYLELDPQVIRTARRYLDPALDAALDDPRVRIIHEDGRHFVKRLPASVPGTGYDVVIVNLPNPSTALINRFFTVEFFREIRERLGRGGILATHLAFSPDYLSPELEDLGASVFHSLEGALGSVVILPEYAILYIASRAPILGVKPEELVRRLEERRIQTEFATPAYIRYRLTTDRIAQVGEAFEGNRRARLNRDAWPIACHYNLLCWISSFQPRAARLAAQAGQLTRPAVAGALLILFVWCVARTRPAPDGIAGWAMAVGSFTLMACEVLIILLFQVQFGYLYHRISLLLAALMLGMAAGTWTATQALEGANRFTLLKVHGWIALYCMALIAAPRIRLVETAFPAMAAVIGALVGFEFPVANRLYLARHGDDHRKSGVIYGLDLTGSCLGALLVGMWILPVLGTQQTLIALAVLNLSVMIAVRLAREK